MAYNQGRVMDMRILRIPWARRYGDFFDELTTSYEGGGFRRTDPSARNVFNCETAEFLHGVRTGRNSGLLPKAVSAAIYVLLESRWM